MLNDSLSAPHLKTPIVAKCNRPVFLITIDTEGDNLWAKTRSITTRNSLGLFRFQALCERYQFKPTYLTNYEMAICPVFKEFGQDVLSREVAEIGMHLHAWNSPPLIPLTTDDFLYHPYLIEYPVHVMREKIVFLTNLLEDTFGVDMISHRAGRWSFNEIYAQLLVEQGYLVDCSVTPFVSYKHHLGNPAANGGTDYSDFPDYAYGLDLHDIKRPGGSMMLEVPMTIVWFGHRLINRFPHQVRGLPGVRSVLNRMFPILKLRPNGRNLPELLRIVKHCVRDKRDYIEFMLHSSEFTAGESPTFQKEREIESLYHDLEVLFDAVYQNFTGSTMKSYYNKVKGGLEGSARG